MNTIEIAGRTYERRDCWCRDGKTYDATNADKVASEGKASGTCSHCRGNGETFHLVTDKPAPARHSEPISEMPDWML